MGKVERVEVPGEQRPRVDSRFRNFSCLRKGSRRYAYNILEGDYSGYPCLTFDYHYETYSTNSKGRRRTRHHRFSSIILGSRVPLKPLFIRTEGFFDKITEFIGIDDIDFESAEFSRTFFVKADDRRWAFDVIHQQTMEFLLAAPRFTIQFERNHVMAFRTSKFKAPEFEQAVETIKGILDRLPEYVIRQQTGEA